MQKKTFRLIHNEIKKRLKQNEKITFKLHIKNQKLM